MFAVIHADPRMLPVRHSVDISPIRREGKDCCPKCGCNEVTDDIHGFLTFACGASKLTVDDIVLEGRRTCGVRSTPCQGDYFRAWTHPGLKQRAEIL